MFQTELIIFLQSFESGWLTGLMVFVSRLGYSSFYIPVIILITFGLNFRKGFLLTQMLLWIGILTDLLKNVIALPRPADVDSSVKLIAEGEPNQAPFVGKGGTGFWSLPDPEAIHLYRAQPEWSFGLPSGHVSGTTTFWGGLSLLFKHAAVRTLAIIVIVLMPISRMYLGRHFLADVLGGFLLAVVILVLSNRLIIGAAASVRRLSITRIRLAKNASSVLFLTCLLLLPLVLLILSPMVEAKDVGRLFGLNVAFVLLALRGLPDDSATVIRRIGRIVVAFVLFMAVSWLIGRGIDMGGLDEDSMWIEFLAAAIPTFVLLWGGVRFSSAMGLYKINSE